MRRRTSLDPAVAAALDELDAALAGERRDPEIALIAAEVRATAPPLPRSLAERLDAAVAAGFRAPPPPPRRRARRTGRLGPALGLAAAAAVAVAVGVVSSGDDRSPVSPVVHSSPIAGSADNLQTVGVGGASSAATPAPPASAVEAVPAVRRVRRAADLTIATPAAQLQDTSDAVARTVDRLGGYVQRSDVSAGGRRGQATFDLRVPAARLDEALASLSRLGHVRSRTQQTQDITARFTSARARLRDARTERQALLRALATATTSQEIASIHARLDIARSRIAAARGDLFAARRAAGFARVGVTIVGVGHREGAAAPADGPWTPRRALGDALDVLEVAAGVAIVALAAAIPAALLALVAVLAWRAYRRRERELALHRAPSAV